MSQSKKVVVYTMERCPYCEKAKRILTSRGVSYEERKVDYDDDAEWERLEKLTGMKTVPQILRGEELIGGCSDLEKLDAQGAVAKWTSA